ncbi:MAG: DUF4386 family protein [Alphaproteobacteria bacterium]|nr:DUF4386 family protein [Alphaproteobacteria bacterium]
MSAPSRTALAALLALQPALFAVPMVVLGQAIGWPGSLRLPAAEILPLIHAHPGAVQLGYTAYLLVSLALVSLALVPLAFALRGWMAAKGQGGWHADALAFLGAAAGILKMLGIVRWLSAMPVLAAQHASADAAGRAMLEASFTALNAYAGAVGELLGVQLTSGLWLLGLGTILLRAGHRWLGAWGLASGALFLATTLRIGLPEAAALQAVAVPVTLLWFAGFAATVARGRA